MPSGSPERQRRGRHGRIVPDAAVAPLSDVATCTVTSDVIVGADSVTVKVWAVKPAGLVPSVCVTSSMLSVRTSSLVIVPKPARPEWSHSSVRSTRLETAPCLPPDRLAHLHRHRLGGLPGANVNDVGGSGV